MAKRAVYRTRPEDVIQDAVITFLERRGWLVERMHGNAFQKGIPDLYLFHKQHGHRWVDIKNPKRNELTKDQCRKWPVWEAAGIDIHIMVGATEAEYNKLFHEANWRQFWQPRYDKYLIKPQEIFEELREK